MPNSDQDRATMRFMIRAELVSAVASIAITIALLVACLLLDRNHARIVSLEARLVERNAQGAQALQHLAEASEQGEQQLRLLSEAVDRLNSLDR
jgi:hypothetical protein